MVATETAPLRKEISIAKQSTTMYLAVMYTIMFAMCVFLFSFVHRNTKEWNLQKTFFALFISFSFIRCLFYTLITSNVYIESFIYYVMWALPGMLLFSSYSVLVWYLAEQYYRNVSSFDENEENRAFRKRLLISINAISYGLQVVLFGVFFFSEKAFLVVQPYYLSAISCFLVIAFAVYGTRLVLSLKSSGRISLIQNNQIKTTITITSVVSVTFLIRGIVNLIWVGSIATLSTSDFWVFNALFYSLVELLPCACVILLVVLLRVSTSANALTSSAAGVDAQYQSLLKEEESAPTGIPTNKSKQYSSLGRSAGDRQSRSIRNSSLSGNMNSSLNSNRHSSLNNPGVMSPSSGGFAATFNNASRLTGGFGVEKNTTATKTPKGNDGEGEGE